LPESDYLVYAYKFRNFMGIVMEAQSDLQYLCDHAKDVQDVVQKIREYNTQNGIYPETFTKRDEFGNIHVSFFRYPAVFDIHNKE